MKKMLYFVALSIMVTLTGCGNGSVGHSSNPPATIDLVEIEQAGTFPVVDGNATRGRIYIHNYSKQVAYVDNQ